MSLKAVLQNFLRGAQLKLHLEFLLKSWIVLVITFVMEHSNRLPEQPSTNFYDKPSPKGWWERNNPTEEGSKDEREALVQKPRRFTIHSPSSVTLPVGELGQRQATKQQRQTEYGADLALQYHRVSGTDPRPHSRTVLEPGIMPAGQPVTTTVPVSTTRMRHSRRASKGATDTGSPLINPNSPSPPTTTGRISTSRQKRRDLTGAPRHTRRSSRSTSMLLAASASHPQLSMDTDPMWHTNPLFNDRRMQSYHTSMAMPDVPEGRPVYTYDPTSSHMTYQSAPPEGTGTGFSASTIPASSGRQAPIIDAGMSPYPPSRSSLGLAGTLHRSPASTRSDRHLEAPAYSQNPHTDPYGNVAPMGGFSTHDSYGYLASQPSVDPMSSSLQQQQQQQQQHQQQQQQSQHPDAIYGPDPNAHYYRHSQSPVSPRPPLRSSPQQALYQPYPSAAPNITVTSVPAYPATVEDIVKLTQVSYLPQPSYHLQSPLPAVSPPSEMSEPERHSPTLQSRSRVPGQRVDVDTKMLDNSFRDNDVHSRVRRRVLDDLQREQWFHLNQDEPKMDVHAHRDILQHGLGMVGRSIYTVFLVEDKESNQWRCLFGSDNQQCKKSGKRFERVERAIEHVRSHLGHRPYACDGTCHKARSTGTICGKRFFAAGYLEDHKKRPQKRANNQ